MNTMIMFIWFFFVFRGLEYRDISCILYIGISEIDKLSNNLTPNNLASFDRKTQQLEELRKAKLKGNIIRSKAKWITEGEKTTKYFCSLEKRNFVNKIIPRLETGEETISDQGKILKETKKFYENLYKENHDLTDVNLDLELRDFDVPKLSDKEKDSLEGLITYPEATNFLRNMNNDPSPGSDGFSAEFFKFFWKKIGTSVVRSLNYGFQEGKLSVTQRKGIVTCIPKEDKPKKFLKNWRPITLLNTIYKIASGVISTRIKSVLNKLISKDQTGFLKGRYIGEIHALYMTLWILLKKMIFLGYCYSLISKKRLTLYPGIFYIKFLISSILVLVL